MTTFGENLRRERELRGISLHEVADATKISVRFLQAIEQDRPEVLPGGIFQRAFLKQYAKFLGLDADRLVADFLYAYPQLGSEKPRVKAEERSAPSAAPWLVLAAVTAVVVLLAYPLRPGREKAPAATTASAVVPASPSVFPRDRVYPPPTPVPPGGSGAPAFAPGGLVLALVAKESCWVSVQVDGVKVVERVLNQGETEKVRANKEIVLAVGNAGGVAFTVNDRPGAPLGKVGEVRRNIVITEESLPSLMEGTKAAPVVPMGQAQG